MKKLLIIYLILLTNAIYAQVVDDFSDGNFNSNPVWTGDDSLFVVNNSILQSNCNTASKSFYLSTGSTYVGNAEWHLYVNLKFSTSGSNYVDYYIVADNTNLLGPVNGYFVRVGNTDDEISLYRKDGSTETLLIDGFNGRCNSSSDNKIHLKIKRDGGGVFTLMDDNTGGGINFFTEGTASDVTYNSSAYIGIVVKQSTASFFNKHFIDDVYSGPEILDLIPPVVSQITVVDSLNIDIVFSEAIDAASAEDENNYSVNNSVGVPTLAVLDGGNAALVHLTFANLFQDGLLNTITIDNLSDLSNNNIAPGTTGNFTYFAPVIALPNEIIISEIMAAPNGVFGLPNAEYLEIYNRGSRNLNLSNFTVTDASTSSGSFPNYVLPPNGYVLVCDMSDVASFTGITNIVGVSSLPSLNNSGDKISLFNNLSNEINVVNYSDQWYGDPIKAAGGYSLERIDLDFSCNAPANWLGSKAAVGGTPGKQNSVNGIYEDNTPPKVYLARIIGNNVVEIKFDEPMSVASLNQTNNYFVDNGIGKPTSIQSISADETTVQLLFTATYTPKVIYNLTFSINLEDCPGNSIANNTNIKIGIAELALKGDVIINEILFNPTSTAEDFIELYNTSGKIIDLSALRIGNVDLDKGEIGTVFNANGEGRLLFPYEYVAITQEPQNIVNYYLPPSYACVAYIADLPSYNDDRGVAVLFNNLNATLDSVYYTDKWHYPLLTDVEGVSLERLSIDRSSLDSTNWHSAAATVRYATPGYINSQITETGTPVQTISIVPETFSPDEDGYNDVVTILYNFEQSGYTANMQVYNSQGQLVQYLLRNTLISNSGYVSWDGINIANEKAPIGIYIIYTEVFDEKGSIKKYKNAVTLGGVLSK